MDRRLMTLTERSDGRFPFTVTIYESPYYTSEVALSRDEAHELWVLLSLQFQKPVRNRRKKAKSK